MSVSLDLEEVSSFVNLEYNGGDTVWSSFNEMDPMRVIPGGRTCWLRSHEETLREKEHKASIGQGGSKQDLWVILLL